MTPEQYKREEEIAKKEFIDNTIGCLVWLMCWLLVIAVVVSGIVGLVWLCKEV